jgi:phenylalanyl-tRNA synthetase beta chain
MAGADRKKVLDRIPYLGLDIESLAGDTIRVEYSPNRPDYGTDFGVARGLRGLLGIETGVPQYAAKPSGVTVSVDRRLTSVRPFISCVLARGLRLDDEDVRQIISLQEDLHNGLGRKRKVVAIGLHNMGAVTAPLSYRAVDESFSFVPLGGAGELSVGKILRDTDEGRAYGSVFKGHGPYPVIVDAKGTVLSFPPIINGEATRVTSKTHDIFVDVTSTDQRIGDDVMGVMATTLAEAGAKLGSVSVAYPKGRRTTPDLAPASLPVDLPLIRSVSGLDLPPKEVLACLGRSRLSVKGGKAFAARYRVDLLHPVDLAEEVALGYGIDRIGPLYPPSKQAGSFNPFEEFLDSASTVMAGEGMIELMTYELTDEKSVYSYFFRSSQYKISVADPKSIDHSILRDSVLPSLMTSLAGNAKSDYPQRVFEIGRVYSRSRKGVAESWHLGALIAHALASYSEAKSSLDSFLATLCGKEAQTKAEDHWAFASGRSASVVVGGGGIGYVGEVKPESLEAFGLKVPVSGFEIDLSALHELLK